MSVTVVQKRKNHKGHPLKRKPPKLYLAPPDTGVVLGTYREQIQSKDDLIAFLYAKYISRGQFPEKDVCKIVLEKASEYGITLRKDW